MSGGNSTDSNNKLPLMRRQFGEEIIRIRSTDDDDIYAPPSTRVSSDNSGNTSNMNNTTMMMRRQRSWNSIKDEIIDAPLSHNHTVNSLKDDWKTNGDLKKNESSGRGMKRELPFTTTHGLTIKGDGRSSSSYDSHAASPRSLKRTKNAIGESSPTTSLSMILNYIDSTNAKHTPFFSETKMQLILSTMKKSEYIDIGFNINPATAFDMNSSIKFCIEKDNDDGGETLVSIAFDIVSAAEDDSNLTVYRLKGILHGGSFRVYMDEIPMNLYFQDINLTDKIVFKHGVEYLAENEAANEFEKEMYIANYATPAGQGGESIVFKCYKISTGETFALKRAFYDFNVNQSSKMKQRKDAYDLQDYVAQIANLAPAVVDFFENVNGPQFLTKDRNLKNGDFWKGGKEVDGSIYEVHEYINGKDLHHVLTLNSFNWYDHVDKDFQYIKKQYVGVLIEIIKQILDIGVQLFKAGVTHRDLSLENFMFQFSDDNDSEPYRIKLIDFGHAIKSTSNLEGRCGKFEYVAPEICECIIQHEFKSSYLKRMKEEDYKKFKPENHRPADYYLKVVVPVPYDHKVDHYSIGVILYLLVFQRFPKCDLNFSNILDYAMSTYPHLKPICKIIRGLLARDIKKRWSPEKALDYLLSSEQLLYSSSIIAKPEVTEEQVEEENECWDCDTLQYFDTSPRSIGTKS